MNGATAAIVIRALALTSCRLTMSRACHSAAARAVATIRNGSFSRRSRRVSVTPQRVTVHEQLAGQQEADRSRPGQARCDIRGDGERKPTNRHRSPASWTTPPLTMVLTRAPESRSSSTRATARSRATSTTRRRETRSPMPRLRPAEDAPRRRRLRQEPRCVHGAERRRSRGSSGGVQSVSMSQHETSTAFARWPSRLETVKGRAAVNPNIDFTA